MQIASSHLSFYLSFQVLFRFSIAFLKKSEDQILQQRDSLHLNKFLRTIGENMSNVKRISWVWAADEKNIIVIC